MTDFPDDDEDYEVGYKKPPKKGQFKPGQSGNPKGRPPSDPIQKMLVEILNESTTIKMHGQQIDMTKKEVVLHHIVNNAAKGSKSGIKFLLEVIKDLTHLPVI